MQVSLPPPPVAQVIVVTGRALPDARAERPFAVELLERSELARAPAAQIEESLRLIPGVQLFRRSDARSGHPTSQGVTLRGLGGNASSRALLILDGVPQSDPFGGWVNWPAFDPATIARIRVVRGGGSVANGPGALAGTIELTSLVYRGASAAFTAGSRRSLDGSFVAGTPLASGMLGLSAHAARGDGFISVTSRTRGPADRVSPYKLGSLRATWAAPLAEQAELQLSVSGFTDRRERGLAFTDNRTDGADASVRIVGSGNWGWSALAYRQWRELSSSFASVSPGRVAATRVSLQDSVPSQALGASFEFRPPVGSANELRFGGDVRRTEGESRELYSYVDGAPTRRRVAGGDTSNGGLFVEAAGTRGPFTISAGGRVDRWTISDGELRERIIASGGAVRDDRFETRSGWLPTGRAGVVYDIGRGLDLRAAAYLGWRLPTLNELFRPFRAGADATAANALLEPERLRGVEIGAQYAGRGLTVSATLFANRLVDPIANVTLARGPGQFPGVGFVAMGGDYRQRKNLDAIKVQGVEVSAEYRHGDWWANAGLSRINARVRASGTGAALNGLRPAQTPRLSLSAGAGWESRRRSLSINARRTSSQFEDDLNRDRLPPATIIDGFGAFPITQQLQLIARAENILDKDVVAGIAGDGSIERATPRTLWLGLRFNGRER